MLEALQAARAKDANPPDLQIHVMTLAQAKELLTAALPAEWSPAPVAAKWNTLAKGSPKGGAGSREHAPGPRPRVRVDDAQLLKEGFNALLDELKARGGTKSLAPKTKGTLQKTREFIVWLVRGTAASDKKWSGSERRQAHQPAVSAPRTD